MPTINIAGLPKEKIIHELFKNVYEKSEEAKQTKEKIFRFTPDEPGIYSVPSDFEISQILKRSQQIDYLGCVKFGIDFSGDSINTDYYDSLHKTGANLVNPASEIIKKLRDELSVQAEIKSEKTVVSTTDYPVFIKSGHIVGQINPPKRVESKDSHQASMTDPLLFSKNRLSYTKITNQKELEKIANDSNLNNWKKYDEETQKQIFKIRGENTLKASKLRLADKLAFGATEQIAELIPLIGKELSSEVKEMRKEHTNLGVSELKGLDKLSSQYLQMEVIKKGYPIDERANAYLQARTENANGDTLTFLKKHAVASQNFDKQTSEQISELIDLYKQAELRTELLNEREQFEEKFSNAYGYFNKLDKVSSLITNPKTAAKIQGIAAIGTQSVSIAYEAAKIAGCIPGIAAATGLGMLMPGINIAIAAFTVFSIFNKKHGHRNGSEEKLLEKIESLRKEIHARFDHIDEELVELKFLWKNLDERLSQLQNILKYEVNTVRTDIALIEEKSESRHKDLKSFIKELGEESVFTTNNRLLMTPLNFYLSGDEKAKVPYKQLYDLEGPYFKELCEKGMGSAKFSSDHTFSQVTHELEQEISYILAYLAEFSQKKLRISIPDTQLPNVDLLEEEVKLALATRSKMKVQDQSSPDSTGERLSVLKQKTKNMIHFIDVISSEFKPLIQRIHDDIYQDGKNKFEAKVIEILTGNNVEELKADASLPLLNLTKIKSTQVGCSDLDEKHLANSLKHEKVASALHKAQRLHLGEWKLSYTGDKTQPSANLPADIGRGWWRGQKIPTMPKYNIKLMFKPIIGEDINVCNVNFKTDLPIQTWEAHHRGSNELVSNYINAQNSISLANLTYSHWASSTPNAVNYVEYRSKVAEKFPASLFATEAWNKVKAGFSQWPDVFVDPKLLLNSQLQFIAVLDQLKAARALALSYAQLIGAPEETLTKIKAFFVIDLKTLIENPALFRQNFNIEDLLQGISESSSPIKARLQALNDMLDLFTSVISKEEKEDMRVKDIMTHFINPNFFRKGSLLGQGGFAKVYKGLLLGSKPKEIAIKEISFAESKDFTMENFRSEVDAIFGLKSDDLIETYGYSSAGKQGPHYILMELAKESLAAKLAEKKQSLSPEQKITWIYQVARGLTYLHKHDIRHGDIKSFNVMLDKKGNAKLADFGLATTGRAIKTATLTGRTSHKMFGSFFWEGCETQEKGYKQSAADDIYAFGVLLWEIVTREIPFHSYLESQKPTNPIVDIILKLSTKKREELQPIPTDTPEAIASIIRDCWQAAEKRPTAQQIIERLITAFPDICASVQKQKSENTESISSSFYRSSSKVRAGLTFFEEKEIKSESVESALQKGVDLHKSAALSS